MALAPVRARSKRSEREREMRDPYKPAADEAALTPDELAEMSKQFRDWAKKGISEASIPIPFTGLGIPIGQLLSFLRIDIAGASFADWAWNSALPWVQSLGPWLKSQGLSWANWAKDGFGNIMSYLGSQIQYYTDRPGYEFNQILKQGITVPLITAALEANPIKQMGVLGDLIVNPSNTILRSITGATLTDDGIKATGESLQATLLESFKADLARRYGAGPDVDKMATTLAANVQGGVTRYLQALKAVKEAPDFAGLSPAAMKARIDAVRLTFDNLGTEGSQQVATLLGLTQNRERATTALLEDLTREAIDRSPAREAFIRRMVTSGGIPLDKAQQVADALDPDGWRRVFEAMDATSISVTKAADHWDVKVITPARSIEFQTRPVAPGS